MKLYVSLDLTKKQRYYEDSLKTKLHWKLPDGGNNLKLKYINDNRKIVPEN